LEKIVGHNLKYKINPRRLGDPASLIADTSLAEKILTFRPKHDIISILQTAYNWHLKNDK
jgi:UDP-glucose 4-epimerase